MDEKKSLKEQLTSAVKMGASKVNKDDIKKAASDASFILSEKATDLKEAAKNTKEDITNKLTELDRMLEEELNNYNEAYTLMSDKGLQLFIERKLAVEVINDVENLVNSISNHPKEFDADFEEINIDKKEFTDTCTFADRELKEARKAASSAGAGLAGAAAVGMMGPTVAMWVATTFGTASTGAAISTLSGAAMNSAALAWLGGGALTAGGTGMAGGSALLAMAGPVGWTIAGATLLTSIVLFSKSKMKLNKEKNEEILSIKKNTEVVNELGLKLDVIFRNTVSTREGLKSVYTSNIGTFAGDYSTFDSETKAKLGAMVNQTKALSKLFKETVN